MLEYKEQEIKTSDQQEGDVIYLMVKAAVWESMYL